MLAAIALVALGSTTAHADRYQRGRNDNPLRLIGYALYPVGLAAEYLVMRPIHWVVSQPHLDVVFGHKATLKEEGAYFEWGHGDYSPSIAEEIRERDAATAAAAPRPVAPVSAPAATE